MDIDASEITDGEGCRYGWGARFESSGVSDESEDSGIEIEWSCSEGSEGPEASGTSRSGVTVCELEGREEAIEEGKF